MVLEPLWVLLGCSWGLLWFLDGSGRFGNATLFMRIGDRLWLLDDSGRLKNATLLMRIGVPTGIRKRSKPHLTREDWCAVAIRKGNDGVFGGLGLAWDALGTS